MTEVLKLFSLTAKPFRLDFRFGVSHSIASRSFSKNIIVEAVSKDGVTGYGEGIPRRYVTGETIESALGAVDKITPLLKDACFSSPDEIFSFIENIGCSETGIKNHSALCAVELALFDLAGKKWGISLSEMIRSVCEKLKIQPAEKINTQSSQRLVYSLVIPLLDKKNLFGFLENIKGYGFRYAKIKVNSENPYERVELTRSILGEEIELRVDANCSWGMENAPGLIKELRNLGVVSVEQPLSEDDFQGSAELLKSGFMHISMDESVISENDVKKAAAHKACDIINVRVSKCGGISESLKMIAAAQNAGIKVQLGAHVGESSLLSAAGAHLASVTGAFVWLEGSFGLHLLKECIVKNVVQFDKGGILTLPAGFGLGIEIDSDKLKKAIDSYYNLEK